MPLPPSMGANVIPNMGVNPMPNMVGFNPLVMMNSHMRMPIPINSPIGMQIPPGMMGPPIMPRSIRTPGSGIDVILNYWYVEYLN